MQYISEVTDKTGYAEVFCELDTHPFPGRTVNERMMLRLGGVLDRPELTVVGLGEVGINRMESAGTWNDQLNKL